MGTINSDSDSNSETPKITLDNLKMDKKKPSSQNLMSQYKKMIQDKFESLAKEKALAISKNMEFEKEAVILQDQNQNLLVENESLKQAIDRFKTDIKQLETKIKALNSQIKELDKENDELEGRLLKIALNKLKPDELLRHKNKFETAGLKYDGQAQDKYEKLMKKNSQAIKQVDTEASKRMENIFKEDYKPKSWQTEVYGTDGVVMKVHSDIAKNMAPKDISIQAEVFMKNNIIQTDLNGGTFDNIHHSFMNSKENLGSSQILIGDGKAGNEISEGMISDIIGQNQTFHYKQNSADKTILWIDQEIQVGTEDNFGIQSLGIPVLNSEIGTQTNRIMNEDLEEEKDNLLYDPDSITLDYLGKFKIN